VYTNDKMIMTEKEHKEIEQKIETSSGTEKVDLLNELGTMLQESDPVASRDYAQRALIHAREIGYESGIAKSFLIEGFTDWIKGDYEQAMKAYNDALEMCERISDKKGIAESYQKIGICYCDQIDYDHAMEYHLKAIEICEEIEDQKSIASNYTDISFIHWKRGDQNQAIKYLQKALNTFEQIGDKHRAATTLSNIGTTYEYQEEFDKALTCYLRALEIWEESGNTKNVNIAHAYNNIGNIYTTKKEYQEALEYQEKSLAIWEAVESKSGLAMVYINMGNLYTEMGDYKSAGELLYKGLELSKQIKDLDKEIECYKNLADLFDSMKNYDEAYKYLEQYTTLREKLFNQEMNRQITEMQTRFESEKNRREAEIYRLRNVELAKEISVRKKVEAELSNYKDHLEDLVKERTTELEKEIAERKKTEEALDEQLRFEMLVSDISTFFMTLNAGEIEKGIEEKLKLIGEFFDVDMNIFIQIVRSSKEPIKHIWLSDEYDQELLKYAYHLEYPNIGSYLQDNSTLIIYKNEDFPENWAEEQFLIEKVGIKSGVIARINMGGKFSGVIAICTIKDQRTWSDTVVHRLKIIGEIFINAIARKQNEEMLTKATKELKAEQKTLTEKNIALNEVLEHIDHRRMDDRREVLLELEKALTPQIDKIKKSAEQATISEIESLEITLNAILGKDSDNFGDCYANLTSRESEICKLIRKGQSSKEISDSLSLSLLTVYKYRERIRRKLKIQNKNVNLATYLRSH
jgi:tetratricopeptide (TPR) repeat protein